MSHSTLPFIKEPYRSRLQKWIDALRSGKYKQCRGTLCRVGKRGGFSYCCLGVACRVYEEETGKIISTQEEGYVLFAYIGGQLPNRVRQWFGIDQDNGRYEQSGYIAPTLIKNNDTEKKTFKQIAKIIEANANTMVKSQVVYKKVKV